MARPKGSGSPLSMPQIYRAVNLIAIRKFSPVTEYLIAGAIEKELGTIKARKAIHEAHCFATNR